MTRAAIDRARNLLLASAPDEFTPHALRFLLQQCTELTDPALRTAVEQGLTLALQAVHADPDPWRRIAWVRLLAEAVVFSDDDRLGADAEDALAGAVDLLETRIRHRYEPGDGLTGATCREELRASCALLDAFELTGRLPYAMLAEELFRHARSRWWAEPSALFDADLRATCAGLQVAAQLAALHADADYTAAAVAAPGLDMRADARRMAEAVVATFEQFPDAAGDAGPALIQWFALESNLQ